MSCDITKWKAENRGILSNFIKLCNLYTLIQRNENKFKTTVVYQWKDNIFACNSDNKSDNQAIKS